MWQMVNYYVYKLVVLLIYYVCRLLIQKRKKQNGGEEKEGHVFAGNGHLLLSEDRVSEGPDLMIGIFFFNS